MTSNPSEDGDLSRGIDLYFSRPGVAHVIWDAGWNVVHVEAQGWSDVAESRTVLDSAIRAMTDHEGSRWLVDGREMQVIEQSHQEWINEIWLPLALAAGLRVAAFVVPGCGLTTVVDDMAEPAGDEVEVRYFTTVAKAREWLAVSAKPRGQT